MYGNNTLYDINPKTLEVNSIGNGDYYQDSISYDPVTERMFGIYLDNIYQIDSSTGEQELIGSLDYSGGWMLGISYDLFGQLYGWDLITEKLWKIYPDNAWAEEVGTFGLGFNYAGPGDFDKISDYIYLVTYTTSGQWYKINKTTLESTLFNLNFTGDITSLAIPYELNMAPPITEIYFDPPYPDGENDWFVSEVNVTFNALDITGVIDTFYRINGGEWKTYEEPFILSEDGQYTIEYYSYDYVGNIEDVKSKTVYIDRSPPDGEIVWYWENKEIIIEAICEDITSGIAYVEFFMDEELKVRDYTQPYTWVLRWPYPPPINFLKIVVYDNAGNSIPFTFPYTSPKKMYILGFISNPDFSDSYLRLHADLVITINYYGIIMNKNLTFEISDYSGLVGNHFINAKINGCWMPIPRRYKYIS